MPLDIVVNAWGLLTVLLVLAAALMDAAQRRFPNPLAISLAFACAGLCWSLGGADRLLFGLAMAILACVPLMGFEVWWRRAHEGEAGLGMGDIKFLAATMLADPRLAFLSFTSGLGLLGLTGLITRRKSLPLLPFVALAAAVLIAAGGFVRTA